MGGTCGTNGWETSAYRVLVNNPEEWESLKSLSVDSGKNINMDVQGTKWDGVNWIDLAQDRGKRRDVVNTVMNLRFP